MKTAGVLIAETPTPVLHILVSEPSECGTRYVTRAWTGLSFAGIVLLGPEASTIVMDDAEYQEFIKSLGNPSPNQEGSANP